MAARIEPLMTVDDLDAMPEDGNRYEVIEGELFVSRAPGLTHQQVTANAIIIFGNYLQVNPIGRVVPTPGVVFDKYSGVIPDIVYYSNERAQQIIADERFVAAPDLLIEILSRGGENIARDRIAKRQLYAKHGVGEYWIIDADERAIEVYRLRNGALEPAQTFRNEDEITSPLLPGFSCPTARFFR